MHTFTTSHSQTHEIWLLLPRIPAPFLGGFYIVSPFILTFFPRNLSTSLYLYDQLVCIYTVN